MNYRAGLQTGFLSPNGLGALYRGRLAEHVVGQELMAADLRTNDKPRFWVRQKAGATAEVDYLHRYRDRLAPVEVKSGKRAATTPPKYDGPCSHGTRASGHGTAAQSMFLVAVSAAVPAAGRHASRGRAAATASVSS